jgi:hypothetical protein
MTYSNTGYKKDNKQSSALHCYKQYKCNRNLTISNPQKIQHGFCSTSVVSKFRIAKLLRQSFHRGMHRLAGALGDNGTPAPIT